MIDHLLLEVANIKKSKAFYLAALKPLGMSLQLDTDDFVAFGPKERFFFFLYPGKKKDLTQGMHIALSAKSRKAVDLFYKEAIAAGGKSNGKPSAKPEHGKHAYSAFVLDLAGNNIEAICYKA